MPHFLYQLLISAKIIIMNFITHGEASKNNK